MNELLTPETKKEMDHWLNKFPKGKQRSAIIGSLHAVQHQNEGFLTSELMDAVANYLDVPKIQVYEVATFYSMFQQNQQANMKSQSALISHACLEVPMQYSIILNISWASMLVNQRLMEKSS